MQPVLQARDICETANITTVQKRKLQKMLLRALENFSIAMTSILILQLVHPIGGLLPSKG